MAGHSRSKNGVALLAYVPAIRFEWHGPAFLSEIAGTSPAMTAVTPPPSASSPRV